MRENRRGDILYDRWRSWMAALLAQHPWTVIATNRGKLSMLAAPFAQGGVAAMNDNSPQFPQLP